MRKFAATLVATALGAGLIPLAPGTWGTIVAIPLVYCTAGWDIAARLALWVAILIAGIWAAATFDEIMRSGDNQSIVIDEVVGFGITAWTAANEAQTLVVAFVLFRFFDIVKPFPIRRVDIWSKAKAKSSGAGQKGLSRYWGGFGVMADDVMAGFYGLAVVALLQYAKILG